MRILSEHFHWNRTAPYFPPGQTGCAVSPRDGCGSNLRWATIIGFSVVLLLPCFWQREIQAGDLSSHAYNAWLASLIDQGKARGLWISSQSNNVLFDIALKWLSVRVGPHLAQQIAVSTCVLLFAWGTILFIFTRWGRKLVVCAALRRHAFLWFHFPHGLLQLLLVDGSMPMVSRHFLALWLDSTACCHATPAIGLDRPSVSCNMGVGHVRLCRFGDLDTAPTETHALGARITEPCARQFNCRPPVLALLVT